MTSYEETQKIIDTLPELSEKQASEQRISFAFGIGNASSESISKESVTKTAETHPRIKT